MIYKDEGEVWPRAFEYNTALLVVHKSQSLCVCLVVNQIALLNTVAEREKAESLRFIATEGRTMLIRMKKRDKFHQPWVLSTEMHLQLVVKMYISSQTQKNQQVMWPAW